MNEGEDGWIGGRNEEREMIDGRKDEGTSGMEGGIMVDGREEESNECRDDT